MAAAVVAFSLSAIFKDNAGGFWQRVGFVFVLAWVWGVGRYFLVPRSVAEESLCQSFGDSADSAR